jgi:hypothetical protein
MDAIEAKYESEFGGDRRGAVMVLSKPSNVVQLDFSPDEMDLGAMRDIPEERVTAVLGIPAAVVGFGTGLYEGRRDDERLRDHASDSCIAALQRLIAAEPPVQMLPDVATERELDDLRVGFDPSGVLVRQDAQGTLAKRQATLARAASRHAQRRARRWAHPSVPRTTSHAVPRRSDGADRQHAGEPTTGQQLVAAKAYIRGPVRAPH